MSTKQIEQELAEMKQRLAKLESQVATRPGQAWREIIGTPQRLARWRDCGRAGWMR